METRKVSWRRPMVAAAAAALLLVPSLGASPAAATTTGTWLLTHSTTLQADHTGNILIQTDNVTLDCAGHTIHGPGATDIAAGVFIDHASGVTVKRCVVTGFTATDFTFDAGIWAADSSAVTISGNTVTNNKGQGIVLQRSDGGVVKDNTATGNGANGIHTTASKGVTVSGNTVTGNAEHGIHIYTTVGGKVLGNTSRSNAYGGIVISTSTQILIRGNTAVGNTNWAGIALGIGTTASTVVDNTAYGNGGGFEVTDSDGNTLKGNSATGNIGHGFLVQYSDGSVLKENTASKNHGSGFILLGSSDNALFENAARGNAEFGFALVEGSFNNTLTENRACHNGILDAVQDSTSTPNFYNENKFCTTNGI